MIKLKTLFRKAGSSSSGSNVKNKNADRVKTNHFESAVTISNNSANNVDNDFEKPTVTCGVPTPKLNNLDSDVGAVEPIRLKEDSDSKMNEIPSYIDVIEYEKVKQQLDIISNEKSNLELTLQELINSHGELDAMRKEVETLKVSIMKFV